MKMKRYIIAALALIGFAGNAAADTSKLLEADGWTKITTLPTATDIANNYYVFVDNSNDLMLTIAKGSHNNGKWYSLALWYQTSVEPTTSAILSKLWILQKGNYSDGSYALQNVEYPDRLIQTEYDKAYLMETNDVSSPNDWSKLNFAYDNGYWTIENGQYPASSSATYKGHLGPWEENNTNTNIQNGQELAGNKSGNYIGHFQIYTITRTKFKENYLAAASSSNPVDISFINVTNPTLDLNIDGWTRSATTLSGTAAGNYCTETWHSSTDFKFYQTVSNLPEGAYQVSVQARSQTNSGAVYVTVGDNTLSTPVNTTTSSTSMQTEATTMLDRTTGKITTPSISLDEGQTLTMGFMDNVSDHWDVFDNFKLYYLGNDLSVYAAARDAVKTTAEEAIASNLVPDACETAIQTAINNNSGDYSTKAEYIAAQNAIQTALDTYFTSELKSAFASFNSFKTKVVGLTTGQESSDALTTFNNAVSTATSNVEAATDAATITAEIPNLRSAALTYISGTEGQFDITFLASQQYSDWKKKDGSNAGIVADQFLTNRPSSIPSFAESYETTCATTGTVLYQTVSDLPAGYYQVGMYAAAMYTSGRGFDTEATEGDANRTYAFAGDLNDNSSILRTGAPISFATARNFDDLTTLDVNVHLSNAGALTFGVQKDANGSNWHFAQIVSIVYSKSPDLTNLKATRDALVAEAQGLLNGSSDYLTSEQQVALQNAITAGNNANDFDALNTVTLTTLPNAINTAKQQVQQAKAAIPVMIAALERFENDYNLVDGTDYSRVTMSAGAWTDLLDKVNAVSTALDDISQASTYAATAQALTDQMDATDASLRLFKRYKAMSDGTRSFSSGGSVVGGSVSDSEMDTDATEQTAIATLNTAFGNYAATQTADFSASAFLGENLDFSAAAGSVLNSEKNNTIKAVTGWEVNYADADTWAVIQTDQSANNEKLYIRKNWGSSATTLEVFKEKMLPAGKYQLSLSWNSDMNNMTNHSQYKLGSTIVAIGEATTEAKTLTYAFEVTEPTAFDLQIGFQKTGKDNTPAQIVADDITLTYLQPNLSLANNADNTQTIQNMAGLTFNVTLKDRTLFKDDSWNTLCLPFNLSTEQTSTLLGTNGTLMELDKETSIDGHVTGIEDNTLYLNFKNATSIAAGTPYIIKWTNGDNITPPTFTGVTISNTAAAEVKSTDGKVSFKGTYAPVPLAKDDKSNLFMTSSNTLSWPSVDNYSINAFRAYFKTTETTEARRFVLNFGDGNITRIENVQSSMFNVQSDVWYTIDGRKLNAKPVKKGIYMRDGQKVIIK